MNKQELKEIIIDQSKENFEKIGVSKFSMKNFARISSRNRNYAKFSKRRIGEDLIDRDIYNKVEETIKDNFVR